MDNFFSSVQDLLTIIRLKKVVNKQIENLIWVISYYQQLSQLFFMK